MLKQTFFLRLGIFNRVMLAKFNWHEERIKEPNIATLRFSKVFRVLVILGTFSSDDIRIVSFHLFYLNGPSFRGKWNGYQSQHLYWPGNNFLLFIWQIFFWLSPMYHNPYLYIITFYLKKYCEIIDIRGHMPCLERWGTIKLWRIWDFILLVLFHGCWLKTWDS